MKPFASTFAFYLIAVGLAVLLVHSARAVERHYDALSQQRTLTNASKSKLKELLESASLGLYSGGTEVRAEIDAILAAGEKARARALMLAWSLFLFSVAFLALGFARRRSAGDRYLGRHLLGVSAVFFAVGVLAPILTIVAYKEFPVVGRIVFSYESKDVMTTILGLFQNGNGFVGALLLLFSILVPLAKLTLSFAALDLPHARTRRLAGVVTHHLGKWSMTDVFVVAIVVSFLSAESSDTTAASLGLGVYFFAAYGILAVAAGHLLARAERAAAKNETGR